MFEFDPPILTVAAVAPLAGVAAVYSLNESRRRGAALLAAAVSAACALAAALDVVRRGQALVDNAWLAADALSAPPAAAFALAALGLLAVLPRAEANRRALASILLLASAGLAGYYARNLLLFAAAWSCAVAPFAALARARAGSVRRSLAIPGAVLGASSACLFAAAALAAGAGVPAPFAYPEIAARSGAVAPSVFALLMLAVALRKGLFPFHPWILSAFDSPAFGPAVFLVGGHMGAYLAARLALPGFPDQASRWIAVVADAALLTALYAAVAALAEKRPRRLFALLVVSQGSFVLAGIGTGVVEGVSGALAYWLVVAVATAALAGIYLGIEARVGGPLAGDRFLGLADRFPRLAVYFLTIALALTGLPGALAFCADELLLHGALSAHPRLGIALPLAAALNAYHVFRLFAVMFVGGRAPGLDGVPDARPRERIVYGAALACLIAAGLAPSSVLAWQSAAAKAVVAALSR